MARTFFMDFNRLDPDETEITVEYSITPHIPATWDDPAEGGEVEIVKAFTTDDPDVTLTADECQKFAEHIAEHHEDDHGDYNY